MTVFFYKIENSPKISCISIHEKFIKFNMIYIFAFWDVESIFDIISIDCLSHF